MDLSSLLGLRVAPTCLRRSVHDLTLDIAIATALVTAPVSALALSTLWDPQSRLLERWGEAKR